MELTYFKSRKIEESYLVSFSTKENGVELNYLVEVSADFENYTFLFFAEATSSLKENSKKPTEAAVIRFLLKQRIRILTSCEKAGKRK